MRRRLVIAIAAVASVAVALLAVPLGVVLSRSYRDQELLRLQRDTVAATRGVDLVVGRGDPVDLPRSPDALAVYDRNGRRVAGRGPLRAPRLVRTVLLRGRPADRSSDGTLEAVVPLVSNERLTGAVRARRSDAGAAHDARAARLTLAAVALGIIGVAALAAVLLGRGLAAPLERLADSARRLGEGDFSVRTSAPGIAEIDAVGAALDATAERLDDLISRERAFSADASHQLRTPLQALRIELESVELRGDGPPELPAALAQVDRLQATIDTLLAVARDTPRTTAVTDLSVVLEDERARWHGALAAEGRPLRVTIDAEDPRVRASGQVVGEILGVLIDNARRHGRGAVSVALRPVDPYLVVDVADEGPGFAGDPEAAFLRRAGAGGGDGHGHGIGLSLARSLAHAEGGRLTVSRSGPAPVLSIFLPRAGTGPRPTVGGARMAT